MPINTAKTRPSLLPHARETLIAAIEAAMNEQNTRLGYEPSRFNARDAAEEVALWEKGGHSSWIEALPWWELPVVLRPAGWSRLRRPVQYSEESWEGLLDDR